MKGIFSIMLILVSGLISKGQNLFNPYKDLSNNPPPGYPPPQNYFALNPNNFLWKPEKRNLLHSSMYTGEYMIMIDHHPWYTDNKFKGLAKSYSIESVSFPFTLPCWDITGCAFPGYGEIDKRALYLPGDPYDPATNKWGNLYRKVSAVMTGNPNWTSGPGTLVSKSFISNSPPVASHKMFPHTVLKHTINIHCTSDPSSAIIGSFSFEYDNTRGSMRNYPFKSDNIAPINQAAEYYDVMFRPELVMDPMFLYKYDVSSNATWFDHGGTINYHPFHEIQPPCGNFQPLSTQDEFVTEFQLNASSGEMIPKGFNYLYPAPFTLHVTYLKDFSGILPAGYEPIGTSSMLTKSQGVFHNYKVDKNIILTNINPGDKIIYNPSECTLTSGANNIVFPSGYKFQTIRGRYPTQAEVSADDTPANGGPYTDSRRVPVRTDLRSENPADPNDPAVAKHSVFASRYYLASGSRITVEPCVGLFDVAFDIKQGATLWFQDKPSTWGTEDKNNVLGRYKIRGLGGAVLRNGATTQFVQNGLITQAYPLHYTAVGTIISGHHVDPDTDAPTGDYVIEPGASVSFTAGGVVILKDGFHAKQGSEFRALTGLVSYNGCSPGNRMVQPETSTQSATVYARPKLLVYPNPGNGVFTLSTPGTNLLPAGIKVISSMGKVVYEALCHDAGCLSFDLGQLPAGVYLVRVQIGRDVLSARLVKQ